MTGRSDPHASTTQYIDQIFTAVGGGAAQCDTVPMNAPSPPIPVPALPTAQIVPNHPAKEPAHPAAALNPNADLTSEYAWLREERDRLEAYTRGQFALITQQREEFLARRTEVEAGLALREQEIHRQMKLLTDRAELLQRHEQDRAKGEADLALQQEKLANLVQQLRQLEQTKAKLQSDLGQQRLLLEHLRFQGTQLQEAARAAQAEFAAFEKALHNRRQAWQDEQANFTARREQLDQRCLAQEKAEESLRRRESELDQMEAELRCEIELREQQLARERQLAREQQELERARSQRRTRAKQPVGPNKSASASSEKTVRR